MLMRLREYGLLVLVALLPFHAVFVTVGTRILSGVGQAPLPVLALWKEVLLLIILLFSALSIAFAFRKLRKIDVYDMLIIAFVFLSIVIEYAQGGSIVSRSFVYGVRYDIIPLIAFFLLRRIAFEDWFFDTCLWILRITGIIVAAYGIVSFFFPQSFFDLLGYSDLHSLYIPNSPIAAFQYIESFDLRRIQATMSGPNQLGLWLLLPLSVYLRDPLKRAWPSILLLLVAIALTFSRSAWIATFVLLLVALSMQTSGALRRKMFLLLGGTLCIAGLAVFFAYPEVVVRQASSFDHIRRPFEAISEMIAHPFGKGLGTAGPASNRTSDACVFLEEGADASWAEPHSSLCVFTGDVQVQPETPCNCPFLPENWYLQIGVELGIAGFLLFLALCIGILWSLFSLRDRHSIVFSLFLAFLGISIGGLFLHSWEDSAIAYTLWALIGAVFAHFSRDPSRI